MEDVNKAADNKRKANAANLFAQLKSKSDERQAHGVKPTAAARVAPRQVPTPAVSAQNIQILATNKRPMHDPDAVWPHNLAHAFQASMSCRQRPNPLLCVYCLRRPMPHLLCLCCSTGCKRSAWHPLGESARLQQTWWSASCGMPHMAPPPLPRHSHNSPKRTPHCKHRRHTLHLTLTRTPLIWAMRMRQVRLHLRRRQHSPHQPSPLQVRQPRQLRSTHQPLMATQQLLQRRRCSLSSLATITQMLRNGQAWCGWWKRGISQVGRWRWSGKSRQGPRRHRWHKTGLQRHLINRG